MIITTILKHRTQSMHYSSYNTSPMSLRSTQSQSQIPYPSNFCTTASCTLTTCKLSYKVLNRSNITEPISDCRIFSEDALYLRLFIKYTPITPSLTITFPKGISIIKDKTLIELFNYEISLNSTHTNLTLLDTTIYGTETINLTIYLYETSKVNSLLTSKRQIISSINDSLVDCNIQLSQPTRENMTIQVTKSSDRTKLLFNFDFAYLETDKVYYIKLIKKLYSNAVDQSWSEFFCKQLEQSSLLLDEALPICPENGSDCRYYYQAELYYVAEGRATDCSQVYFSSSNIVLFPNIENEFPEPEPDADPKPPLPQDPISPLANTTRTEFTTEMIVIVSIGFILVGGLIGMIIFCFVKVFSRVRQRVNQVNLIKEEHQKIEKEKEKCQKDNSMSNDKKLLKAGEDGEDEVNSKKTL